MLGGESTEGVGQSVLEGRKGAGLEYAESLFELGPAFFDWVEVGRVGWKIEQPGPGLADAFGYAIDFMCGQVVHDNNLTGLELWAENMIEVSQKNVSIGSRFDCHGGDPAGNADRAQYSQRLPAACRNAFTKPRDAHDATVASRHFRRDTAFVEEDELRRIDLFDFFLPEFSLSFDSFGILLCGVE